MLGGALGHDSGKVGAVAGGATGTVGSAALGIVGAPVLGAGMTHAFIHGSDSLSEQSDDEDTVMKVLNAVIIMIC